MGGFFEELSDRRMVSISLFIFLAVALAHKTVDARFTGNMVEVFHENVRVPRIKKSRSTQAYDAPSAHALGASGDDELLGWQDKSLGQKHRAVRLDRGQRHDRGPSASTLNRDTALPRLAQAGEGARPSTSGAVLQTGPTLRPAGQMVRLALRGE